LAMARLKNLSSLTTFSFNWIDPRTGLKYSEMRVLQRTDLVVEIFNICFRNQVEAQKFFDTEFYHLSNYAEGNGTSRIYNKLCKVLGKGYVDSLGTPHRKAHSAKPITVCGETFESVSEAVSIIGIAKSAFENYHLRGKLTKKVRLKLIKYFGEEVYWQWLKHQHHGHNMR